MKPNIQGCSPEQPHLIDAIELTDYMKDYSVINAGTRWSRMKNR